MLSLFFRNLLFTILQPGIVAGLVPYLIVGAKLKSVLNQPMQSLQYVAVLIFFVGVSITLICIISFAIRGQGTLSPADPTKKLVVTGLYRFSRNPMYIGVLLILIGETIFFQSISLLIYSFCIFLMFNAFILFLEEPRLRKDFEKEYEQYCKTVRKWI
jgi:protein-S-isoprenylcysteine O-methyltransferase Ste14